MLSRRELIVSVTAAIAFSGCFAPGGPKWRVLSFENMTVREEGTRVEISAKTDFFERNMDSETAFNNVEAIGFTEAGEIICRKPLDLEPQSGPAVTQKITLTCSQLPDYVTTTTTDETCESTDFDVYKITRTDSNYTVEYVGDRQCDDSITMIPE